jgi:mono/diheme cytochrome c family protein
VSAHVLVSLAAAAAMLLPAAASAADAPPRTPEMVATGQASFAKRCVACHGPKGAGDGIMAKALKPPPRNLVTEPLKNGATASDVFTTLTNGVPGTAMASLKGIPEEERWALAYFVVSLREDGAKAAK